MDPRSTARGRSRTFPSTGPACEARKIGQGRFSIQCIRCKAAARVAKGGRRERVNGEIMR
ncbi:hypothetical protein QJS10_CPA16g01384 [Acorus calamus]|uniref:30S ribosomal protein S14 n=1 Tax=Acorus calamus TaxID=4465 RepID=A0AAV9D0T5_ACOCL|nr:hypothetical protein QJS10_CPA16g01384 [Acorus calamus]